MRFIILLMIALFFGSCQKRGYHEFDVYSKNGEINCVIETAAGSVKEVKYKPELYQFTVPVENGKEKKLTFPAFPFNTGFIPSTYIDFDGDEVQIPAIILGETIGSTSLIEIEVWGAWKAKRNGTNVILVLAQAKDPNYRLYDVNNFSDFEMKYNSALQLCENYLQNFVGANSYILAEKLTKEEAIEHIKKNYRKTV